MANNYDYWYVPCMWVDDVKLYEAKPGESRLQCHENIKKVFDAALR